MGNGAVDPLEKIHDPAERIKRWEQGVVAVFAGFVAACRHSGIPTSIAEFCKTEQWGIILPTIRELASSSATKAQDQEEQGVEDLQLVLARALRSSHNKFIRPSLAPSPHNKAEMEVVWELTSAGKKTFAISATRTAAVGGVSAARHGVGAGEGRSHGSSVGVSSWWNA